MSRLQSCRVQNVQAFIWFSTKFAAFYIHFSLFEEKLTSSSQAVVSGPHGRRTQSSADVRNSNCEDFEVDEKEKRKKKKETMQCVYICFN